MQPEKNAQSHDVADEARCVCDDEDNDDDDDVY